MSFNVSYTFYEGEGWSHSQWLREELAIRVPTYTSNGVTEVRYHSSSSPPSHFPALMRATHTWLARRWWENRAIFPPRDIMQSVLIIFIMYINILRRFFIERWNLL